MALKLLKQALQALSVSAIVGLGSVVIASPSHDAPGVHRAGPDKSSPPNVVMILVDQMRADVLSFYGGQICRTPALDRLAARSVIFDRAYTPLPVCSPARASILTGLYPHTHRLAANTSEKNGEPEYPLTRDAFEDSPAVLSRRLKALGYENWYIGKWHLGNHPGQLPRDFDMGGHQFAGHGSGGYAYPEYWEYLRRKGLEYKFTDGPHMLGFHQYGTLAGKGEVEVSAFLAEDSLEFLDRWSEKRESPFFLYVNFWGPHTPYYPTQEYLDLYRNVEIPPWPEFENTDPNKPRLHRLQVPPEGRGRGWDFWEPGVRHYFAFTSLIDDQIGRILQRLRDLKLEEDTIVIFSADHGESLGSHGGIQNKGYAMYEETMRVPLLIHVPGIAARRERGLAVLNDLYPTILEAAGDKDPEAGRQARSLLPLMRGASRDWRTTLGAEFHGLQSLVTQRMIVNQRYKYIWNMGDRDEVYDLQEDPHEMHNRFEEWRRKPVVRELQEQMLAWMKETEDPAGEFFEFRYLPHERLDDAGVPRS